MSDVQSKYKMSVRCIANLILLCLALTVSMTCAVSLPTRDAQDDLKYIGVCSATGGVLFWPVLFDIVVGYDVLMKHPYAFLGFLWPLMMGLIDMRASADRTLLDVTDKHGNVRIGTFRADVGVIVTTAFAMGSLMSSKSDVGSARLASPLIMFALVLCLAFVLPAGDAADGASFRHTVTVQSVQKVALNYAVGFVLTGIALATDSLPCPVEKKK